jgi:NAD(P)H-dependent flavin oxidoreductase YrpB (nitropropane dioxygenase family)
MPQGVLARLGATIPVVAAPMAGGASTPELVDAAARAGGLGFLAAGYLTAEALDARITATRRLTPRFGVNLFAPNAVPISPPRYATYAEGLREVVATYGIELPASDPREDDDDWSAKVELLVERRVPLVSFTFGIPGREVIERFAAAGSLTAQNVTTVAEAQQAAAAGVDVLIVQSSEAGAHSATTTPERMPESVPLTELVQHVRAAVDRSIWAAGGVGTARQVHDALVAGAEAVVVGTVLLRSPESGASAVQKAALADPRFTETILTRAFTGRPARALVNDFVRRFDPVAPSGYPAVHYLTSPLRKAAAAAGDDENVNLWAGTGYRHATEEPAADILRRLASQPD